MGTLSQGGVGDQRSSLKLFHQNIRGLLNKSEELEIIIARETPDFVCITEHFLKSDEILNCRLNNYYCAASFCRTIRNGGGSGIWCRPGIRCEPLDCLEFAEEGICELAAVSILVDLNFKILFVAAYRPPSYQHERFLNLVTDCLNKYESSHNISVVMGDLNIDLSSDTLGSRALVSVMTAFGLRNIIKGYTREAFGSRSLIDHVFTNGVDTESFILNTCLSDHYAQTATIYLNHIDTQSKAKYKHSRSFSDNNINLFNYLVSSENWEDVYAAVDLDTKFDAFMNKVQYYLNSAFPKKYKKIQKKDCENVVLPAEVLNIQKQLFLLYNKVKHLDKSHFLTCYYRRLKYQYRRMIRNIKSQQYLHRIETSNNRTKAIWDIINNKRNQNNNDMTGICLVSDSGEFISAPADVCSAFNNFFSTVGSEVKIPNGDRGAEGVVNRCQGSLFLNPTSTEEILNIINDLKNKKSAGADEISPALLKKISQHLLKPLCHLVNFSLTCGSFPRCLKTSVVRPLFKKGDKKSCNSYRPISIVSVFSKVLEKVMLVRLLNFLENNNVIVNNQHGFVKKKSTTSAIFSFLNDVVDDLDSGNYSAGLFFDLSKAFDVVEHRLLLQKISEVGIRGIPLQWIASYLGERKQYVEIRSVDMFGYVRPYTSLDASIVRGVPQGSVLGPILFLLFINTLPSCTSSANITLFADDTSLNISSPSIDHLEQITFLEANSLIQWFHNNSLTVNSDKTQLINFGLSKGRVSSSFSLLLNETEVHPSQSVLFLGLVLDEYLSFHGHIERVSGKLSSGIFVLRSLGNTAGIDVLLSAYYGLIYPHLAYAVPVWGCESRRTLSLFKLQKWAVRTIFSLRRQQSCWNYFRESRILTFPSIYILETLTFVKQNLSKFNSAVTKPYPLRNSNSLTIPKHKTAFFKKNLLYNGITLYNALPASLQLESNPKKFRKQLKGILINLSCYSVREFTDACKLLQ